MTSGVVPIQLLLSLNRPLVHIKNHLWRLRLAAFHHNIAIPYSRGLVDSTLVSVLTHVLLLQRLSLLLQLIHLLLKLLLLLDLLLELE